MQSTQWVLGLTGGIGSGKSTASAYLSQQGARVVDADVLARQITQPGQPCLTQLAEVFGADILLADGQLDRALLRQRAFVDAASQQQLNAITHPAIEQQIQQALAEAHGLYTVLEAPLLFENRLQTRCQLTLLIDLPEPLQIQRSCLRDQSSVQQIQAIIQRQMPRTDKQQLADTMITNSGSPTQLYAQLDKLHQQCVKLAQQAKITF